MTTDLHYHHKNLHVVYSVNDSVMSRNPSGIDIVTPAYKRLRMANSMARVLGNCYENLN